MEPPNEQPTNARAASMQTSAASCMHEASQCDVQGRLVISTARVAEDSWSSHAPVRQTATIQRDGEHVHISIPPPAGYDPERDIYQIYATRRNRNQFLANRPPAARLELAHPRPPAHLSPTRAPPTTTPRRFPTPSPSARRRRPPRLVAAACRRRAASAACAPSRLPTRQGLFMN